MEARSRTIPGQSGHHAVQFYGDSTQLCDSVADFLGDGIAAGQPLVLIATPTHRAAIIRELKQRTFDVDRLLSTGEFASLDAQQMLDVCMQDGMPNPRVFRETVGQAIAGVSQGRADCVVRAYGEMVDVLWRSGQHDAAIRLEVLWNDLARSYSFSLLCGYSMGSFYKRPAAIDEVCDLHTHAEIAHTTPTS